MIFLDPDFQHFVSMSTAHPKMFFGIPCVRNIIQQLGIAGLKMCY